jgi:hypothetical protein
MASTKIAGATPPSPIIDYAIETVNGKFILVLLVPDGLTPTSVPTPELRQKYPQSGLYTQMGSLLWSIDWYLPPGRTDQWITLLEDGEHLIVWAQPLPNNKSIGQTACDNVELGFYEQGMEVKSYRIRELVACPGKLPQTENDYFWRESFSVNLTTQTLRINTTDDQIIDFDVTTGNVINTPAQNSTAAPGRQIVWQYYFLAGAAVGVLTALTVMSLSIWLRRAKRN